MAVGAILRAVIGEPSTLDFLLGSVVFELAPSLLTSRGGDFTDVLIAGAGLLSTGGIGAVVGVIIAAAASKFTERIAVPVSLTIVATVLLQVAFRGPVIVG
jgi:hypothetical protein